MRQFAPVVTCALTAALVSVVATQPTRPAPAPRLPVAQLEVRLPSARVTGERSSLRVTGTVCRASVPLTPALRQDIVDIAVQEWAFLGFSVVDQTIGESDDDPRPVAVRGRGRARLTPEEGARVAASVAGYWAVPAEGARIANRQNESWSGTLPGQLMARQVNLAGTC